MINLSGRGRVENGGSGVGGVWLGVVFDASCKFAAYEGIASIMQWGGEAKLDPKHEQTVKLASQYSLKHFKEEHLSVCLTVLFNRHL